MSNFNLSKGSYPWEKITGKPNLLDKDLANQPGEAPLLDAQGKILANQIPENPFAIAVGVFELFTARSFESITTTILDPSNGIEHWFMRLGEAEQGMSSLVKKIGETATLIDSENPTGQPIRFLVGVGGTGNLETIETLKIARTPYNSYGAILFGDTYPPNLKTFEIEGCDNLDLARLTNLKFLKIKYTQQALLDFSPLLKAKEIDVRYSKPSAIVANNPALSKLILVDCTIQDISNFSAPLIRFITISNSVISEAQIIHLIDYLYTLEQSRAPQSSPSLNLSNTIPITDTDCLSQIDWLRNNRGWTITHN